MRKHVNLLPPSFQKQWSGRRAIVAWAVVWVAVASGWGILKSIQLKRNSCARLNVATLEKEFLPLKKMKRELVQINSQLSELKMQKASLIDLRDKYPPLSLLEQISDSCQRVGGMYLEYLGVEPVQDQYKVTLRGVVTDRLDVARLAASLRDSQYFSSVMSVKSTQDPKKFQLECRY